MLVLMLLCVTRVPCVIYKWTEKKVYIPTYTPTPLQKALDAYIFNSIELTCEFVFIYMFNSNISKIKGLKKTKKRFKKN